MPRIFAADFCEKKLAIYADIYYNIYPLRGVAQLVARLLWEQDAVGSSPATPTKKPMPTDRAVSVFQLEGTRTLRGRKA